MEYSEAGKRARNESGYSPKIPPKIGADSMKKPTQKQIDEAVQFLNRWDKKSTFKFGYWFKLVGKNQLEIFNENETEFLLVDLPQI